MTAPLAANGSPASYDLGPLGSKVYITGAISGLAYTQSNRIGSDQTSQGDLSNAQINNQQGRRRRPNTSSTRASTLCPRSAPATSRPRPIRR
ncbi:MAG: hypothetical protein WDN45_09340 [Caulobacteraceae bacterium]